MKKLLAIMLALCLLASMPLMAMATTESATIAPTENKSADTSAEASAEEAEATAPATSATTTDGSQKLTFSFDASISGTQMSEDDLATAQGVVEFVKSLTLDIAFAEANDMVLLNIVLRAGDSPVGEVDIAVNAETMYISGDMLPEGWITVDMAELDEALTEQFNAQVNGMPTNQEAAMQAFTTLVEQLLVAVNGWMTDHPEMIEQMPLENLPSNVDPVAAWIRLNISKEMYPAIYQSMDASLRALAADGELTDFDGSVITAANYETSAIGQMMGELVETMDDTEIEGVIDVLADAQDGLPGLSVDLTVNEFTMFMTLLRQTADTGAVAWNGEYEIKDTPETTRVEGDITATNNAPDAETRRIEGAIDGRVIEDGTSDESGSFGLSGYIEYPGDTAQPSAQLFRAALQGDITASESEKADFIFEMYANQGAGEDVDFNTTFGFNFLDGTDQISFSSGLGIAYQQQAEGLDIPDFTGAKLYPVTDMSEEEMEAYTNEAQGTLMGFLFKLLAAMPPSLQSQMMQ